MNQTGCPAGFATDEVLLYASQPLSCNVNMSAYIVLSVILMLLKTFASCHYVRAWVKRQYNEKNKKRLEGRLPIVPIISWLSWLLHLAYFILIGLGVADAKNGLAAFLFGIGWTYFAFLSILFLLKFVSLGYRIAPRSAATKTFRLMPGAEKLSHFNIKGKISLFICVLMTILQFIFFCIVPFFYAVDDRYIRAGFGIQGYFLVQHAMSITNHFERVKHLWVDLAFSLGAN